MLIFVVRHAKAEERLSTRWPDDSLRPLTSSGAKKFARLASRVERLFDPPALLLSSGYVRAWETARILTDEGGWPDAVRCPQLECDSPDDVRGICEIIAQCTEPSLGLVGHEPMLSDLVNELIGSEGPGVVMAKGAIAILELPAVGEGCVGVKSASSRASLVALLDPKWIGGKRTNR